MSSDRTGQTNGMKSRRAGRSARRMLSRVALPGSSSTEARMYVRPEGRPCALASQPAPEPSRTCENVRAEGAVGERSFADAAPVETSASASARRGSKAPTCGGGSDRRGPAFLPRRHGSREEDENRVVRSPADFLVERETARPSVRRSYPDTVGTACRTHAGSAPAITSCLAVRDERRRSSGKTLPHRSSRTHRTLSARRAAKGR
ncbi:hypothetical protein GY45DRAFT_1324003, partial [Cubamyces sp. BRFM 1775]